MLKKVKKVFLSLFSVCMIIALVNIPMDVNASSRNLDGLVNDLILYYRDYQDKAETDIERVLNEIKKIDNDQYLMWKEIISYWHEVRSDGYVNDGIPKEMPNDDSLVILVLGAALLPDGSMKEELLGRMKVALEIANAYPNAYIAVSGGATASENPNVTEGGVMAEWLISQGISKERIIVEEQAPDTVGNINYVYNILKRDEYKSIDSICVVTSDYHVPRGLLLVKARALLGQLNGDRPLNIVGNAGYFGTGNDPEKTTRQSDSLASLMGISLAGSVSLSVPISLAISQNTPYETGKELDLTVNATFNTNYTKDVTDKVNITNFDPTLDETQTITVSYTENESTITGTFTLTSSSKEILDTTSLKKLIETAETIDLSLYTASSVSRLIVALESARKLLEDDSITLVKMEEAKTNLTSAIHRLVYNTSSSEKTNLAAGIIPTASSNTKTANLKKMTDSNEKSFWISQGTKINGNYVANGQYVIIDLGQESIINEINIHPYYDDLKGFENLEEWDCLFDLYASNDQETWVKIAEQKEYNNVTSKGFTFTFDSQLSYRYVKLVGKEAYSTFNTTYTYALLIEEIYIYGTTDTSDPNIGNIALGKPTSESLNASKKANPYTVVDGNIDTFWGADSYTSSPWVCIDLEDVYEISSINVINYYSRNDRYYNYDIYTSINGEVFTYLDSYTGTDYSTDSGITFEFDETVYAQYIKVVGTYNSKNSAYHINEVRIYGTLANDELVLAYQIEMLKNELKELINKYEEKYQKDDYSEKTWNSYISSINEGEEILQNDAVTLEDVQNCINKIKDNVSNLKYKPDQTKEEGSFRIASFNIAAYNHPNTEAILEDLFMRYNIDYAGVQEVDKYTSRNNYDVLSSFVDNEYFVDSYFGKFMDYQGGEYGVGLLSKTKIYESKLEHYFFNENQVNSAWARIVVEVDGKKIAIYNTHLSLNYEQNRAELEQVLAAMDADEIKYKILMGDFNCHREWMYECLINYNLANGKDGLWLNTAGVSWKEGNVSAPYGLDNIVTTRNIDVKRVQAIDSTDYSDHDMIFIECKLLDEEKPSKEYLNIEVNDAKELVKEKYTSVTWNELEIALNKADALDENANQAEINEILFEVQNAVANLERVVPDISKGKKVLSVGSKERTLEYINDGDIYTCWDGDDYPDSIIMDLEDLYEIDEIQVFPHEHTPRYYHYEVYTSIDGIYYTLIGEKNTDEIEDYKGATLNVDGMARYVKINMTYCSVSNEVSLGELKVYAALVDNVDDLKEALKELVDSYSKLNEDDYIPTSYALLQEVLVRANEICNDSNVTKEEVKVVYSELEEAYDNLIKYADKTVLKKLIEENKDKDLNGYSTKSANKFLEVLSEAIKVSEDPYVSQKEVDNAGLALKLAIEDLIVPINIAQYMIVDATSNNENAQLITDGKASTTWTSEKKHAEVIVDLDGIYILSSINVVSESNYEIYISEDGTTWAEYTDNRNARYIKIIGNDGLSISEILAYGEEIGNIALDKSFTSSEEIGVYNDRKVNDGNRYNYWGAGKCKNFPWISIDLEEVYDINHINVITHWSNNDRYYRFQIYTSIDGEEYTLLTTYSGNDLSTIQGYKFDYKKPTYARYIKVVGTSNSANTYFHLCEIRAYGEVVDYELIQMVQELKNLIEKASEIDSINYTDESKVVFEEIVEIAKKLVESDRISKESVEEAITQLNNAIEGLTLKKADYTVVDEVIANAEALDKSLYKDVTALEEAINDVVRDKNITEQAEVDAMAKAIEDALAKLEYKDADYSKVDEAIAKAEALNKDEYEDLSALEEALANVVRGKNITQQDEVDAMAQAIEVALAGLVKVEQPTEPQEPVDPIEPTEPEQPVVDPKPEIPTQPTRPTTPTQSTTPTENEEPTVKPEPEEPTQPEKPAEPEKPEKPNQDIDEPDTPLTNVNGTNYMIIIGLIGLVAICLFVLLLMKKNRTEE